MMRVEAKRTRLYIYVALSQGSTHRGRAIVQSILSGHHPIPFGEE